MTILMLIYIIKNYISDQKFARPILKCHIMSPIESASFLVLFYRFQCDYDILLER